jgi:hypothetical protein
MTRDSHGHYHGTGGETSEGILPVTTQPDTDAPPTTEERAAALGARLQADRLAHDHHDQHHTHHRHGDCPRCYPSDAPQEGRPTTPQTEAGRDEFVQAAFGRIEAARAMGDGFTATAIRVELKAMWETGARRAAAGALPSVEGRDPLAEAVIEALDVYGSMGNGEGWTLDRDVIGTLWLALTPGEKARTGYDVTAMDARMAPPEASER